MTESILLFLLASANFTHILDFVIMMPLGPLFMRTFDINATQFGFLVSAYGFSASIFGFICAAFIDKFDRKNSFLFLYVGFILGTLCCAMANSYEILMVARIIAGAFGGGISGVIFSIISDKVPIERRGKAMGIVMAAFSAATVAGVPLGVWLASEFNWHTPFFFLSSISFALLVWSATSLPKMKDHLLQENDKKTFSQNIDGLISNFRKKEYLVGFLFVFVLMLGGFSVIPFISPYMVFNVGVPESKIALIYLCGGLCTLFTSPLFGKLADKFGAQKIFFVLAIVSVPIIFSITNLPSVSLPFALFVMSLFMIFVAGRMVPGMTLMSNIPNGKNRGAFMSLNGSIQQMGSGVASLLSGQMISRTETGALIGYNLVGFVAIFFTIIAVIVSRFVKPEQK
jgi:MFS transporter, DHA1 family, inner membrane transport protein